MEKTNKNSKKIKIIIVVSVLAIIGVIFSIGNFKSFPWQTSITVSNVTSQDVKDNDGIVIEDSGMGVLFLDENKQLINKKQIWLLQMPFSVYGTCYNDTDLDYVSKYEYEQESSIIKNESIYAYDKFSNKINKIFEIDYSEENRKFTQPCIVDITSDDNFLYITLTTPNRKAINVWKISKEYTRSAAINKPYNHEEMLKNSSIIHQEIENPEDTSIYLAAYVPQNDSTTMLTTSATMITFDTNNVVIKNQLIDAEPTSKTILGRDADNNIIVKDQHEYEGKTISYSPLLILRILLFWIGLAFLIFVLIYVCVKAIKSTIKNRSFGFLKTASTILLGLIVCASIVIYYTNAIQENDKEHLSDTLMTLSGSMSITEENLIKECINDYQTNDNPNKQKVIELNKKLNEVSNKIYDGGLDIDFAVTAFNNSKQYIIASSTVANMYGTEINDNFIDASTSQDSYNVKFYTIPWGSYIYASVPIYNDGKFIGCIAASEQYWFFNSSLLVESVKLFFTLFVIMLTFSFLLIELKNIFTSLRSKRRLEKNENNTPILTLSRPLHFFITLTTSFDLAIIPLISKDMLAAQNPDNMLMLISIPTAIIFVGYFIAVAIHDKIFSKFNTKNVLIFCIVCIVLTYIFTAYCVLISNFFLYIISLLISSVFCEVIYLFTMAIPLASKSETLRAKLNRDMGGAKIAASSIAMFLGGVVADNLGNCWVYICVAVTGVIYIVFVIFAVPKSTDAKLIFSANIKKSDQDKKLGQKLREAIDFMSNSSIIILLTLIMIISMLTQGYRIYIFPIYAEQLNLSKTFISNLIVVCSAFVYYCIPLVLKIERKLSTRNMIILTCVIIGGIFMSLIINFNLLWAVVVLLISILVAKILDPSISNYWHTYTITNNKSKATGQKIVYSFQTMFNIFKTPLLGSLMSISYYFCFFVMGVWGFVSAILFALTSKKKHK